MLATTEYLKELIAAMGFTPQDGENGVFFKTYPAHHGYIITIDFNEQKIEYAFLGVPVNERIRLGDTTTSNFTKSENFVVLECVDRLLEKGYKPGCIELEKKYPLGRNLKGKLDILVYDENVPFLMIECKTWGTELEKETHKMLKDGGQLFSYYAQDRLARYLCLYASHLDQKNLEYCNNIVAVQETWRELSSTKDIHDYWNKTFEDNGIFENYAAPYSIKHKARTCGMLKTLKEEDSGKIFNQIMEILRHNAISDKPNAFNKLLNLFVCKIIDENSNPDDELKFQWLETDNDESLQMRLNDLYKEGMWRFLEIKVIDHSEEEVSAALEGIDDIKKKQQLKDMFRDARLKKSPNFAFIEVLDDKTFKLNAKIVREVVELLQPYKFRYEQKHEFLGNFFELLLNTSMKQEAGQYFTPVPITRFIISSLPLKEFAQKKIDSREYAVLPAVIDYACGSGHFLTEYMEQMQNIIDRKIDVSKALPDVRGLIQSWQGAIKFAWAKDTVYGIDLDNRLVKTTKVSAFFNGDGEANIIWANGLDNFEKTEEYRGLLKNTVPYETKNNGQFDILISNPPYSVEAFKSTLKYGEESFDLYNYITDSSSEIECLFVERMKQLLKVGGWAGVILPSSILSNGGIYLKTREILLKCFKFKAIVELGSGTFMKTGTNTVILFLERRSENDSKSIERAINRFFDDQKDVTVLGIENAFSRFVANVYDDLSFENYLSFINMSPDEHMVKHELYQDYLKAFGDDLYTKAFVIEREKMLCFLLTCLQDTVIVKAGNKQDEKKFLGYEFSERRGHEGMKWLPGGTKLYDESNNLQNPQRVNSYIYNAFLKKELPVDESLAHYVSYGHMCNLINYGTNKFDKQINLNSKFKFISSYPSIKLNQIVQIIKGVTYTKDSQVYDETNNVVLTADNITNDSHLDIIKKIYLDTDKKLDESKRLQKDDIFICFSSGSKEHVGKCAFIEADTQYFAGGFMGLLRKKTESIIMKYLWVVLSSKAFRALMSAESNGTNINNLSTSLGELKIPLPSIEIQQQIVDEIRSIEDEEKNKEQTINQLTAKIDAIVFGCFNEGYTNQKLGTVVQYSEERINCKALSASNYVGVDNLLPNVGGKTNSQFLPKSGSATAYYKQNILLSNIRPYLKKIWFADNNGGSSGDVLVLKIVSDIVLPKYLYYHLATESFFDFEMQNVKGVKMPRADKNSILAYQIPIPSITEQEGIIKIIEQYEDEISMLRGRLEELNVVKSDILRKYLY